MTSNLVARWLALTLLVFASMGAFAQGVAWDELSPGQRELLARDRFTRWQRLDDGERAEVRRRYEAYRELSNPDRDRLREIYRRFNRLSLDQQEALRDRFRQLPPQRREDLRDRALRPPPGRR